MPMRCVQGNMAENARNGDDEGEQEEGEEGEKGEAGAYDTDAHPDDTDNTTLHACH